MIDELTKEFVRMWRLATHQHDFKPFREDELRHQVLKCGCDTPIELRGKCKDNSPELDHIIPISKGGPHSYNNIQLLCRRCNGIKSDTIIE